MISTPPRLNSKDKASIFLASHLPPRGTGWSSLQTEQATSYTSFIARNRCLENDHHLSAAARSQIVPISRLPAAVDGRLHVQHRDLDAEGRPKLAGARYLEVPVPAGAGRVPGRCPDPSVLPARRRGGRPHGPLPP